MLSVAILKFVMAIVIFMCSVLLCVIMVYVFIVIVIKLNIFMLSVMVPLRGRVL